MRRYDPCSDCAYRGECVHGRPYKNEDGQYECDLWEPEMPEEEESEGEEESE